MFTSSTSRFWNLLPNVERFPARLSQRTTTTTSLEPGKNMAFFSSQTVELITGGPARVANRRIVYCLQLEERDINFASGRSGRCKLRGCHGNYEAATATTRLSNRPRKHLQACGTQKPYFD